MNDYKTFNDMGIERTWEELYEDNVMLKKENQQLKIQISAREKEYKKLEDNWNKLKEYVKEEIILQFYNDKLPFEIIVENVLNKMKELERGVSDDSN